MTMLSIVGHDTGQIVPVLHAYRDMFDEHVLICDALSKPDAQRLAHGMRRYSTHYHLSWKVTIQTIDADDLTAAVSHISRSVDDMDEVWLNVTDGYPALVLMLGRVVEDGGGTIISYDQHHDKLYLQSHSRYSLTCAKPNPPMTLRDYITLMGYRISDQKSRADLIHRRDHILRLYKNQSRFRDLRYALLYPRKNSNFRFDPYRDLLVILEELDIVNGTRLILSQQKVLQGDLFEEFVFWSVEGLGMDDIAMGVVVDMDEHSNEPLSNRRIHNEFDILLIHHNRICTIECKYSTRLDGLDLVYKYDAITDYFGEHTRAILLNISNKPKEPYLGMNRSSNFNHSTLRRARRSHIHIYHRSQIDVAKFQSLVKSFFRIGGENE